MRCQEKNQELRIFPKPLYLALGRLLWGHTLIVNVKGNIRGISSWGEPKASASLSGGILLPFSSSLLGAPDF